MPASLRRSSSRAARAGSAKIAVSVTSTIRRAGSTCSAVRVPMISAASAPRPSERAETLTATRGPSSPSENAFTSRRARRSTQVVSRSITAVCSASGRKRAG